MCVCVLPLPFQEWNAFVCGAYPVFSDLAGLIDTDGGAAVVVLGTMTRTRSAVSVEVRARAVACMYVQCMTPWVGLWAGGRRMTLTERRWLRGATPKKVEIGGATT